LNVFQNEKSREGRQKICGRPQGPFVPGGTLGVCGQTIPALKRWAIIKDKWRADGAGKIALAAGGFGATFFTPMKMLSLLR
jgi:hypothetical protein